MTESDELSRTISLIYDAALDPAVWPAALEATAGFLRSATVSLGSFDALQSNAVYNYSWGDDPAYTAIYVERYARLNPLIQASVHTKAGDVASASSIMSYKELYATQVFREWAKPQGYVDIAQATLEKSGTAHAVLAAVRHESVGRVDSTMLRRMSLLVPHFRRAVLIGKVIDLKKVEAAAFAETIDGLAASVFLVDARGRLIHANASGAALLADGDAVRLSRNVLIATDAVADRSLRETVAAAWTSEAELAEKGVSIPLTGESGQTYAVHVLPLASGARRVAGVSHAAVAAIFLHRAVLDIASPVRSVARRFGLTPTETRVLRAVVDYGGVTPIAATLGMSEATVKTHLQRLFKKTETARQVDLVKLNFGFIDPMGAMDLGEKSPRHQPNG
jgi:DNA-binding CsgD family transcriptional regulator